VLPSCRAAVHHGGAGTTHAVLRAGLSAAVAHVFADQSLWGQCVSNAGAGSTLPYRRLDAGRLVAELRPLLQDKVKARAEQLG
jgi:sterol 3beta-glucosyltransferase